MTNCAVRGCDQNAEEVVTLGKPRMPALQWAFCGFHAQAIRSGEKWTFGENMDEILLGSQGPLQLVNFKVSTDVLGHTVTLELGHDGIKEQEVVFTMEGKDARSICFWVGGGKHNFDGGLPDEGTRPEVEGDENRTVL